MFFDVGSYEDDARVVLLHFILEAVDFEAWNRPVTFVCKRSDWNEEENSFLPEFPGQLKLPRDIRKREKTKTQEK